eukprot:6492896-Prymnesium_polylepis.1
MPIFGCGHPLMLMRSHSKGEGYGEGDGYSEAEGCTEATRGDADGVLRTRLSASQPKAVAAQCPHAHGSQTLLRPPAPMLINHVWTPVDERCVRDRITLLRGRPLRLRKRRFREGAWPGGTAGLAFPRAASGLCDPGWHVRGCEGAFCSRLREYLRAGVHVREGHVSC